MWGVLEGRWGAYLSSPGHSMDNISIVAHIDTL